MTSHRSIMTLALGILGTGVALRVASPNRAPQAVEPELFLPGIVSTGLDELNAAFSPDGGELYYSINAPENGLGAIVVSQRRGGSWSSPQMAPFSGRYSDYDPFFSADGSRLFFISNRPATPTDSTSDYDIWVVDRRDDGWSVPVNVGAPVNTERNEYYPAVAGDGTLYFSAVREGGQGSYDVYRARWANGAYDEPENLGPGVNARGAEIDTYVSPDQRFVVFAAYGRRDGPGRGDLYISHRKPDGTFGPAELLGHGINSSAREYCPIGSPDGTYFYWTSKRGFADTPLTRALSIGELRDSLAGPRNGEGDIYRIPMRALRP